MLRRAYKYRIIVENQMYSSIYNDNFNCLFLFLLTSVFFLYSSIFTDIASGLRDVSIHVPLAVRRGDDAHLLCNYNLENDTLYSVKWYKGRREFYRYLPKENPAMKLFPLAGINVEVSNISKHFFIRYYY